VRGRCKKPWHLVGRKKEGSWGQKIWVPRPNELGFIPLSAHPGMVHWWLLGRSGRRLQWGKIGLIPQLVGKPVREICTVPSSECFTLGNHPTSSRAPGRNFLPGGFMPNKVHPSSGPHQLSTCELGCLLIPKPKHSQTKRASKTPRNCISRDFLCAAEK